MRTVRIFLWMMVAVVGGAALYLWAGDQQPETAGTKLGGPFSLVRHDGSAITEKDLDGRRYAIFFGFTHCPDICPTTLLETAGWMQKLGGDADKIDFYFMTVDPERDTVEILKDYVTAFDERITGITGSPAEVDKAIKGYKVYAKRVDLEDDDYTMDHSASVLLFDREGNFKGTISYGESSTTAVEKLQRLIDRG